MYIRTTVKLNEHKKDVFHILKNRLSLSSLIIRKIKREGFIFKNGSFCRTIDKVYAEDLIELVLPEKDSCFGINLNKITDIEIIYQDDWVVVCNKPANLVTHPSYLHQKLSVTSLLAPNNKLHPISRLDKDTSGVLLLAKCGYAQDYIVKKRTFKKYLGFVHGLFNFEKGQSGQKSGLWDSYITRASDSIILRRIAEPGEDGAKRAITEYKVLKEFPHKNVSLLEFTLLTGRTHQIRLHCLDAGHPLVGETLYGLDRLWQKSANLSEADFFSIFSDEFYLAKEKEFQKKKLTKENEKWENYQGSYLLSDEYYGDYNRHLKHLSLKEQALWLKNAYTLNNLLSRQALHAWKLECFLPFSENSSIFEAALTQDLQDFLAFLNIE